MFQLSIWSAAESGVNVKSRARGLAPHDSTVTVPSVHPPINEDSYLRLMGTIGERGNATSGLQQSHHIFQGDLILPSAPVGRAFGGERSDTLTVVFGGLQNALAKPLEPPAGFGVDIGAGV